jgi:hypothetical protein
LARAEKHIAVEPGNGSAMSFIVTALAALGEHDRASRNIQTILSCGAFALTAKSNGTAVSCS